MQTAVVNILLELFSFTLEELLTDEEDDSFGLELDELLTSEEDDPFGLELDELLASEEDDPFGLELDELLASEEDDPFGLKLDELLASEEDDSSCLTLEELRSAEDDDSAESALDELMTDEEDDFFSSGLDCKSSDELSTASSLDSGSASLLELRLTLADESASPEELLTSESEDSSSFAESSFTGWVEELPEESSPQDTSRQATSIESKKRLSIGFIPLSSCSVIEFFIEHANNIYFSCKTNFFSKPNFTCPLTVIFIVCPYPPGNRQTSCIYRSPPAQETPTAEAVFFLWSEKDPDSKNFGYKKNSPLPNGPLYIILNTYSLLSDLHKKN